MIGLLYFAFGSNMDGKQMHRRCPGARAIGRATLQGWSLAFRRGVSSDGVATIVPEVGAVTRGRVWSVTESDLLSLDRHEGVRIGIYGRAEVAVDLDGRELQATAYVLQNTDAPAAAPSSDYLSRIATGWASCGWPLSALADSAGLSLVFVYGTLKRGEGNHALLEGSAFLGEATTRGVLGDCGFYPAMATGGHSVVRGEVFAVNARTLDRLDRLEGVPHLYQRTKVRLGADRGTAWAYVQPVEQVRRLPQVQAGSWSRVQVGASR